MAIKFSFKKGDWEYTIEVEGPDSDYVYRGEDYEEPEYDSTVCDVCGRTFKAVSGLRQHQTVMGHND